MQLDFHYCCVKTLAHFAGFDPEDAETIGYASQYVDDACEHKPLRVAKLPSLFRGTGSRWFDPTCTAWNGINYLRTFFTDVQRKVFIPFHFLPGRRFQTHHDPRRMMVLPGSTFSEDLVRVALKPFAEPNLRERRDDWQAALIGLGIALHTYADTFSHRGFSGRRNYHENHRWAVRVWQNGCWKSKIHWLNSFFIPSIGHASAWVYPDQPVTKWSDRRDLRGRFREYRNQILALNGARRIFLFLQQAHGDALREWTQIKGNILQALTISSGQKSHQQQMLWAKQFPSLQYQYDPKTWRREGMSGPVHWEFWPGFFYGIPRFEFAGGHKFFHFHVEARKQRLWVLEQVAHHPSLLGTGINNPFR